MAPSSIASIWTDFAAPLILFVLLWIFMIMNRNRAKKKPGDAAEPPVAGGKWPIIGHLHLLAGSKPAHLTLADMADKHGPIFTIKLGVHTHLIVANWEIAKDCLTTNDQAFATRPKTVAIEHLTYNQAMFGFAPYGAYWRQSRKTATLELLSNHRLKSLKHVQEAEVRASIWELYDQWRSKKGSDNITTVPDMRKWFGDLTMNVIVRIIVGKRVSMMGLVDESVERFKEKLREAFELHGKFLVSDALPYLRWLDIGGDEKRMKSVMKELDQMMDKWLKEYKWNKATGGDLKGGVDENFMGVMLSIIDQPSDDYDIDTMNKAMCLNLIMAATDTTTVTLTWVLSLLLNNRKALDKVQQELDLQVGRERPIEESDTKNLIYLHAVIKETLRLYPAAPLSVFHEAMSDCVVAGHNIKAGTQLMVHLYKIQCDPNVWTDALEFRPERFLTTHKDFDGRGTTFEFMPFGSGRRMCPGVSFALQTMSLTLGSLLQAFQLRTPMDEAVDMTEGLGVTMLKETPLQVELCPRLPNHCYTPPV